MGPGLFTRVWRSELPISLGTGEFLEQGYSSKRHRLTPRCLPTPNPPNHLLATKLGTECWLHLARKPRGSSLEQMDKGTVWTHPQAFNTSNRLTNHGQQVHLDLSPGWCAVFVTEPGSLCPSFAAKMLRCQFIAKRGFIHKAAKWGGWRTNLESSSLKAGVRGIYGRKKQGTWAVRVVGGRR